MGPIFAMSVTATQSSGGLRASAHLSLRQDDRRMSVTVRWPDGPSATVGQEAPQWLYSVLCHLVENFDDHEVTEVDVDTVEDQAVNVDA